MTRTGRLFLVLVLAFGLTLILGQRSTLAIAEPVTVAITATSTGSGVLVQLRVSNGHELEATDFMVLRGSMPPGAVLNGCWTGPNESSDNPCIQEGNEAVWFSPGVPANSTLGPFVYRFTMSSVTATVQGRVLYSGQEVKSPLATVKLTTLSAATIARAPAPDPSDLNRRYFSETGHSLGYGFKAFWEANNGTLLLGPPITEEVFDSGVVVQYFRKGRLEWDGSQVTPGDLGADYLRLRGFNP